ncbi:MAG: class I SAM-dependent methyltransferase [Myxococcota bacterium]
MTPPEPEPASAFVLRHRALLDATAPLGPVADVACGRGRNTLELARGGRTVVGIDRSASALHDLTRSAASAALPVQAVRADLEADAAIPLRTASCGAVVVTRYLHRSLCDALAELLAPGGLLLYETFTRDQTSLGYGPKNPAFLLEPGELPRLFPSLQVVAAEEGLFEDGRRYALARLLARREG